VTEAIAPVAVDRPRFGGMLLPLSGRDFRLYWIGQSISLVGDGIYLVAVAWQVYEISNSPTALAVVGIAQTLPLVCFVLVGGALADRLDRRKLLIAGAAIPGVAISVLAALAASGSLELWHVWTISAVVGVGRSISGPASGAFVPQLVAPELLVQANSLGQVVRPLAMTLVGPALGGVLVGAFGFATAFALDAASFGAAVLTLLAIASRPRPREHVRTGILADLREGFAYVRTQTWIWGTLLMATIWLLLVVGPFEVLVPFIVKNDLGGGAKALGLLFAAGGLGAIVAAIATGQRGLPRRPVTWMILGWGSGCAVLAGVGLATATWQAALAMVACEGLITVGEIIWITLLQTLVPAALLGRVRSLDWLLSVGLVPLSFAVTGPVAGVLGAREVLVGGSLLAGVLASATLLLPGMRAPEQAAT
jgi:DHA3 family tetracycline resistance protein-like MFS transporter